MHDLRHPPGEALRLPHPPQACRRIALAASRSLPLLVERVERARQHDHVGEGEVHALGAGRRHDVRAVAGEEQPPVLHRLDHEAAHRRDALLQHLAFGELARAAEPRVQLVPDARVRPVLDVLVVVALQIEPRQRRRAHGVERKAAVGVGIDQLVIGRRRLRQNAEPAERIVALEAREHAVRECSAGRCRGSRRSRR